MDPYLEHPAWWPDFHQEMISACRAQLVKRLPDGYGAKVDERMRLVTEPWVDREWRSRDRLPDVALTRDPFASNGGGGGTAVAAEPALEAVAVEMPLIEAGEPEHYIQIIRPEDHRVVTVIELLSPSNKIGDGWHEYQYKRHELMHGDAHLVELDLLQGGQRADPQGLLPAGDCYTLVTRRGKPLRREVYAWPLARPLPRVPIPLEQPDPDVPLDLAAAFTDAFDRGGYARQLRREADSLAALDEEQRMWARGVVQGATATA